MIDTAAVSNDIIRLAQKLRQKLGTGLYEKTYVRCLAYELEQLGYKIEEDINLDPANQSAGVRRKDIIDILVENTLILNLRNVDKLLPHHELELLSTLRNARKEVGILINFNQPRLQEGIKKVHAW